MKTGAIVGTGLIGAALLGATIIQARGALPAAPEPARPDAGPRAARQVAAEGRVVAYPGGEVQVSAERSGRLVRVLVEEGRRVQRGELLAEIDADELLATLAEARARLTEAEAELRLAELNRERSRQLVEEGVASAQSLDQAERDLDTARARRETARATIARYEAQLRKSRVLAPISGVVTSRAADAGETVEPGDLVATLADVDRLRVEAEADEADSAAIALGAATRITADGQAGRAWRGHVEQIADSVTLRKLKPQDPARPTDTRILSVKVAFDEPTELKLGTTVELRIDAAASR